MADKLISTKAPALPVAPQAYARQYLDQLNNVLRLYFSQIDTDFGALLGADGGRWLSNPCGSFFSNVAQSTTANTVTIMTLNNTDSNASHSVALTANGSVQVTYAGVYNYQFSAQFQNSLSQDHDAWVWLRVDGVDVYESATQVTVPSKHGSINGAAVAAWNFVVATAANSVIDLVYAVSDPAVVLGYAPAQVSPYVRPSIPSLITTVTFVSSLPATSTSVYV